MKTREGRAGIHWWKMKNVHVYRCESSIDRSRRRTSQDTESLSVTPQPPYTTKTRDALRCPVPLSLFDHAWSSQIFVKIHSTITS